MFNSICISSQIFRYVFRKCSSSLSISPNLSLILLSIISGSEFTRSSNIIKMSGEEDWWDFQYPEPEYEEDNSWNPPQQEVPQYQPMTRPNPEPSEVHFNNLLEARNYAKFYKYGGFVICPAKILSHIRIDKRRNLTMLNITYYPPTKQ